MTQLRDQSVDRALTAVVREEGARILALLADRLGDLDLAQDCLHEAYAKAVSVWSSGEVPSNPAAWIYTVARNAGIDVLRREAAAARKLHRDARVLETAVADAQAVVTAHPLLLIDPSGDALGDEELRVMLLCCHPALEADSHLVLMLRLAAGLTTEQIAKAYLLPEPTIAQRIVRAKRKIRAASIPLTVPTDLAARVPLLCSALALMFNEGYVSRTAAAGSLTRVELADRAIRLTAVAADAIPESPELAGLLAMQLFHRSRERARCDASGALVPLAAQDKALWDRSYIARGHRVLQQALAARTLGPWQLKALIAAEHTRERTDWQRIVRLYDALLEMEPAAVTRLSRAVALAEVEGPAAALAEVRSIEGLENYYLFHAAVGDLASKLGDHSAAAASWRAALELTSNPAEQEFLRLKLL